jgi:hypothetical protein
MLLWSGFVEDEGKRVKRTIAGDAAACVQLGKMYARSTQPALAGLTLGIPPGEVCTENTYTNRTPTLTSFERHQCANVSHHDANATQMCGDQMPGLRSAGVVSKLRGRWHDDDARKA